MESNIDAAVGPRRVKIACRNIWKVFGEQPQEVVDLLQQGQSKARVLEETGESPPCVTFLLTYMKGRPSSSWASRQRQIDAAALCAPAD